MATEQATIGAKQAAELVARAQQGDQVAFATLYEQYRPLVYRFLRRRLDGADETVEDLTEDVFVKLYEKLDRYVERGVPFTAWLYRIAHNQLVDFVRTLPRHTAQSLDVVADVAEHNSGCRVPLRAGPRDPRPALARLTAEQRKAVELRFLHGMSVAETSAAIGRSEEAVKKLQARGLANLRRSLVETAEPKPPARLVRAA